MRNLRNSENWDYKRIRNFFMKLLSIFYYCIVGMIFIVMHDSGAMEKENIKQENIRQANDIRKITFETNDGYRDIRFSKTVREEGKIYIVSQLTINHEGRKTKIEWVGEQANFKPYYMTLEDGKQFIEILNGQTSKAKWVELMTLYYKNKPKKGIKHLKNVIIYEASDCPITYIM